MTMYIISKITDDPSQEQQLVLYDGSVLYMSMYYSETQKGWFFDTLQWNTITINGLRIVNSPNMLHQFRNQLTFGMSCISIGNREPMLVSDFSTGASTLYILSSTEVAYYNTYLTTGAT